jgi:uncharacterized membrane protein YgcG
MKILASTLIVTILFASATTVFAAQNDLPTEPLYGVKTVSEDASLWLMTDPTLKLERLIELAQLRIQEMTALAEQDATIPELVVERLRMHIETALQLAAGQNDSNMQTSLLQIQSQLQTQEQTMMQLQSRASGNAQPALEQARIMTQEQLRLSNQGLDDPLAFRNRYQFQNPAATGTAVPTLTGTPPEIVTVTAQAPGYGPGPNAQETPGPNPTPGAGYGPGPNPTAPSNGGGSGGGGNNGGGGSGGGGGGGGGSGGGKP